jgi:hypothetical protein
LVLHLFYSLITIEGGEGMKKFVLTGVMLLAALLFAGAQQGYAYDNVTSTPDGGCLQCHAFAGGSGAGHTTHSAASVSCTSCHDGSAGSVPVKSSKCIVCHPQGDVGACNLVNLAAHPKSGAQACLTCHVSCASTGTEASCADWKGKWDFTYDSGATTKICFDNSTVTNDTIQLCTDDNAIYCQCITDNASKPLLCIDNTTFENCAADNITNCVCVDNPLYGLADGKKAVTIDNATSSAVFFGKAVPCYATGTQGATPITIVQVDNDTAGKLGIEPLTYIVFEGTFDNATFAQILPANFTKDNNSVDFTAETDFNLLGLVSGTKSTDNEDNTTVCEQKLKVFPPFIFKFRTYIEPFSPFVIVAPRSSGIEFSRPISIDWGTDAINDLIHVKIGKRLIFGFGFARPFKLEKGDYTFTVTYGDNDTQACGKLKVGL